MPLLDDAVKAAQDLPPTKNQVDISVSPEKGRVTVGIDTQVKKVNVGIAAWVERIWKKSTDYGAEVKMRWLK